MHVGTFDGPPSVPLWPTRCYVVSAADWQAVGISRLIARRASMLVFRHAWASDRSLRSRRGGSILRRARIPVQFSNCGAIARATTCARLHELRRSLPGAARPGPPACPRAISTLRFRGRGRGHPPPSPAPKATHRATGWEGSSGRDRGRITGGEACSPDHCGRVVCRRRGGDSDAPSPTAGRPSDRAGAVRASRRAGGRPRSGPPSRRARRAWAAHVRERDRRRRWRSRRPA